MTYGVDNAYYAEYNDDTTQYDNKNSPWNRYYPYGDCSCGKIMHGYSHPSSGGGGVPSTTYRFNVPTAPIVGMSGKQSGEDILPTANHSPTFLFGLFFVIMIILGIWYGKPQQHLVR